MCAKKDWSAERGYLVYRYGRKRKVELEYPKNRSAPRVSFKVVKKKESADFEDLTVSPSRRKQVATVNTGFAFTPSDVTYQIMQTDTISNYADSFGRILGDEVKKTSHALNILLPRKKITIPCKSQKQYSIATAVSHFTKTLLPPNDLTACRKGESNFFDCITGKNRTSICQMKGEKYFARLIMKDGGKHSFLINPTQENPLKVWQERHIRSIDVWMGFNGSQGSIESTGTFEEGEPSTKFIFKQPKIELYCPQGVNLMRFLK